MAAFAPEGNAGLAPAEGEIDYLAAFKVMLGEATPRGALGMRLALWLVALAPIWLWGRLTTFSALAIPRRTALLRELLRHRSFVVRELTTLLKFCAAMVLLGDPAVRARSGYDNVQATEEAESGVRRKLPVVADDAGAPVRVWPGHDAGDGIDEEGAESTREVG